MVVAITLFLGTLFPLIELFTVFVILYFAVRLVGYPIKSYWSVLLSLV